MRPVSLLILSDPICPWCFIGKRRLDAALAQRPDHPFAISWAPFMLNPDMAAGGVDRRAYLEAKFGGPQGAAEVYAHIAATAAEDGLTLDFDAIARTPSTVDAHRVTGWARGRGADHAMQDALFVAYFQQGRDIGDRAVLAELAAGVGLDGDEVRAALDGDADVDTVRREAQAASQAGVTGAPTFVIGARQAVAGAQPTSFWLQAIDHLAQARRAGAIQEARP
jgi:predicted DsbA family dithiol-disulfide isomerase